MRNPWTVPFRRAFGAERFPAALALTALMVVAVLVYIPALQAGFVWDDDDAIRANPFNQSLRGLWQLWSSPSHIPLGHYWPLTFTTFWLEFQIWGASPVGYHVVNVLLHALNAAIVFTLLRRIGVPGAWLAAACFALHPMQAESVAWVIERKNLLCTLFCLLAAHCYISHIELGLRRHLGAALALFVCAMLSKSMAVTFPLALLLWHWNRGDRLRTVLWGAITGFFAVAVLLGTVHAYYFLRSQPESSLPFVNRLIVAAAGLWFYMAKLLWPHPLMTVYPRWQIDPLQIWQWVFPVATGLFFCGLHMAFGRGRRALVAALAFFAITLLPVLNLVDQPHFTAMSFVNDHAVYLASIGFFCAGAMTVCAVASRLGISRRVATGIVAVLVLPFLGILTWRQAGLYRNMESLFSDAVARNPHASVAHYNLARALFGRGAFEQASKHYREAARLDPRDPAPQVGLGACLVAQGDPSGAERAWRHALTQDPSNAEAHVNLAGIEIRRGRPALAVEHCNAALRNQPANPDARANLAGALIALGSYREAEQHLRAVIADYPGIAGAHVNLALALVKQGRWDDAEKQLRIACDLVPGDTSARIELARLLDERGRPAEAAGELRKSLAAKPDDPVLNYRVAVLETKAQRPRAAVAHLTTALKSRPDWTEALTNLAWIRSTSIDDSVRDGKDAVRLAERADRATGGKHPLVLDTLAAAYAESGQFDRACETAERALATAAPGKSDTWTSAVQDRLQKYRKGESFRE